MTESPSSLLLSLEHDALRSESATYFESLRAAPDAVPDACGCAFAVGGNLVSADLYATPRIFRALWPKLLASACLEAIARRASAPATRELSPVRLVEMLKAVGSADARVSGRNAGAQWTERRTDDLVARETFTPAGAWVHSNFSTAEAVALG